MLSFKPAFSLSSFTVIKRLFSSLLSAIRVVSSAYLRLLIFLLAILIPACASSSPVFLMMYSACKLKTGVPVYGYCVMPHHVHIVLGPSPSHDIVTFVGQFKNLAQRALWDLGLRGRVWQVGFYDHFLRTDEGVELVVHYVVD